MMKTTSEIIVAVIDHGLFLPVARRLARDVAKVYYSTETEKAFPTVQDLVGDGFDDIERVDSIWQVAERCDAVICPDIGFAPLQRELLRQGKPVWGAREADALEVYRGKFLDALIDTRLPVPKFTKVIGMTALREHLKDKQDRYVKISRFRGDWETFHWRSYEQDTGYLDIKSVQFGPLKEQVIFYVFDPIDTDIEDGIDTYCIDGKLPDLVLHAMENKDLSWLGGWQRLAEVAPELRIVSEEFSPILERHQYRSFFSTEVRITPDGESFFIDPTLRAGSPPSQAMCELIENYGDVVWHGANGELVEPKPVAKFGAQAVVNLKNRRFWSEIEVDDELDQWLKCGNCIRVGDSICFPPDPDCDPAVGYLVGIGDTVAEAVQHLQENAKLLPSGVCCDVASLADLVREMEEAADQGIEPAADEIPDPAIALTASEGN
jgi:hypothetical protein